MAVSPERHPFAESGHDISPLPPKLDTSTRPRSSLFQPPKTPIAGASSAFAIVRSDDAFGGSRKRTRLDRSTDSLTAAFSATANGWTNASAGSSILRSDAVSPVPFVNTRYTLAGGMDTPSLAQASTYDKGSDFADADFRRRWSCASPAMDEAVTPATLMGERNGMKRCRSSPNGQSSQGWGRLVFSLVGGVAGKLYQFSTSAFKGFYAGGGQGYDIKKSENGGQLGGSSYWEDIDEKGDTQRFVRESTPVPGQFPQEDYFGFKATEDTPPRPAKRLNTGDGWVMIPKDATNSRASSPRLSERRTPNISVTTSHSYIPRPSPRQSLSRPSLQPVSRRQSARVSYSGSPAVRTQKPSTFTLPRRSEAHIRQNSGGSVKSPTKVSTPLSPEAQKYAAHMRRKERQEDESMRKMNEQLRALIQQGQEALGTKYEVEYDGDMMEDEGFAEGHPSLGSGFK